MRSFSTAFFTLVGCAALSATLADGQNSSASADASAPIPVSGSTIALRASSTMNVVSEMGGAFMSSSKCDADGNLYIRKFAADRPLLGPVVKIDADGKRVALFDPAAFSQLGLERADAFSPASDGGLYQIAQSAGLKPRIYVLHYASDGSPASPARLDADFEVYTFAAFAGGNFLVSGVRRDAQNKDDHGRNFTAVFSADGRELARLSFEEAGRGKAGAGLKLQPKDAAKAGLCDRTQRKDYADAQSDAPAAGSYAERVSCFRKSAGGRLCEWRRSRSGKPGLSGGGRRRPNGRNYR